MSTTDGTAADDVRRSPSQRASSGGLLVSIRQEFGAAPAAECARDGDEPELLSVQLGADAASDR
jgi:hypothetical protein